MFKKLVSFVLALVMGLQPFAASAADLNSAFSGLFSGGAAGTVSAPGRYSNGARNLFVGGSVEMRFPSSTLKTTLFSISPPSFSAGCNGISAHFGGMSFISGKEIETLVKNIAQGATGLVVNMVIKALCPMCEAVLQNMQKLAQMAAKVNMDSCRIATNLLGQIPLLGGTSAGGSEAVAGACKTGSTDINEASDEGVAQQTICSTMTSSMNFLNEKWAKLESNLMGPDGKPTSGANPAGAPPVVDTTAERCALGAGNCTYLVLAQIFKAPSVGEIPADIVAKRLLLMNLMGTSLVGSGATCGSAAEETPGKAVGTVASVNCLPKLEPKQAVGLFMCGDGSMPLGAGAAVTEANSAVWRNYCYSMFATGPAAGNMNASNMSAVQKSVQDIPLMDCDFGNTESSGGKAPATDAARYVRCDNLKAGTVASTGIIKGAGFLLEVQQLLQEAVRRVRANEKMGGDEQGRKIIELVNIAPYPLYQAINAAAVYPEAGQMLVDSLSLLVADHLAYKYFTDLLSMSRQSGFVGVTLPTRQVERIASGMNSLHMAATSNRAQLAKTMVSQQLVMEEIRKVNQSIQSAVMTEEMLGMQKYAHTINKSAVDGSAKQE